MLPLIYLFTLDFVKNQTYYTMLETLISSKTRVKLLLKFFLNSNTTAYLRNLESEFGDSTNAIRVELNRLEDAGLLQASPKGNKKIFQANIKHPLYKEINSIVLKYVGIDHIIENIVKRLGDLEKVYLTGEFARGLDSQIIDLVFVGNVDKIYLIKLVEKAEKIINRKIRYIIYAPSEMNGQQASFELSALLLWSKD